MPISTRRFGRLGNELYQLAAVIAYAKRHNLEWSAPKTTNDEKFNPIHFPNLYNPKWQEGREDILINEHGHQYQEIPFKEEWRNKQIVLNGYWQSFRYWDWCKDEILKAFNFPYQFDKDYCSIHVRRGDYLRYPTKHPVVTPEYLTKAMVLANEKTGVTRFKVFSDDIKWCKNFFSTLDTNGEFIYSEGKDEMTDLLEMSWCAHNICSNSTMALWGAELNQNPDKVVIVPSEDNWFGPDNSHLVVYDMYRPEWLQIKY